MHSYGQAFAAGRFGFRIFHRATHRIFQLVERVSGVAFLEDISEFLLAFEGMSEAFRVRAGHVQRLLLGPDSGFVLVAGASPEASRSASDFLGHLESSGVPMVDVILNRVRMWPGPGDPPESLSSESDVDDEIARLADALRADDDADATAAARAAVAAAKSYASLVRLDARWLISTRSPMPANTTVCSPTMSPPRTVANPMVCLSRAPA